jgi:hypothetical protein
MIVMFMFLFLVATAYCFLVFYLILISQQMHNDEISTSAMFLLGFLMRSHVMGNVGMGALIFHGNKAYKKELHMLNSKAIRILTSVYRTFTALRGCVVPPSLSIGV